VIDKPQMALLLLLLLRTLVERKIRINTPNALSQQLNRNVFSLALKLLIVAMFLSMAFLMGELFRTYVRRASDMCF